MKIRNVLIAVSTSFVVLTGQMAQAAPVEPTGAPGDEAPQTRAGEAGDAA